MEYHEVVFLFPELEQDVFLQLVADIRTHGLLEPIYTYQGKIIDGRHRHRACQLIGVEPSYREWDGRGSLVSFVVSLNLHRRHLTSSQRAVLALDVERLIAAEAKGRQRLSGGDRKSPSYRMQATVQESVPQLVAEPIPEPESGADQPPLATTKRPSRLQRESAEQAAQLVHTNHLYIRAAKKLQRKAPEVLEKVRSGIIGIKEALVFARIAEPALRQEAMRKRETGEVKTAKAAELAIKKAQQETRAQASLSKPLLVRQSCHQWLPSQPFCDLLLTDPPYMTEMEEEIEAFAASWLPLALSRVKATGRAYVFIGAYPEEISAYLRIKERLSLPLQQILVWSYKNTLGPKPSHRYKQNWQAILYFCGQDAPPLDCPTLTELFSVQEVNAPDGRQGERYHTWQKPDALAERLIRHATKPGDLVLDPFCGTGTFVLAAGQLGREGRGCDHSADMLEIAQRRGCLIGSVTASLVASSLSAPEPEKWA